MADFYCRATNQNTSTQHLPYPGTKVVADDKNAAAAAFAVQLSLPINTKILVIAESELTWYVVGQVTPTTGPTYS